MQSPRDQNQAPPEDFSGSKALALFSRLLNAYSGCFTLLLRARPGSRFLTSSAVGGMGFQFLFLLYYPEPRLILFFPVWLAAVLWHRLRMTLDAAKGEFEHRWHHGYYALVRCLPFLRHGGDGVATCLAEPGLVFF